jgi:hypothetical protein
MEWRVTIELSGADGTRQTHEVARSRGTDPRSTRDPVGLTLDDGKAPLAGVHAALRNDMRVGSLRDAGDFAATGPVRRGAADRVARGRIDHQIVV